VREEEGVLTFEFVEEGARPAAAAGGSDTRLDRLRDRVDALGGRLTVEADAGHGIRVYGALPLSR
jgi:signal transduction histidine kinase